MQDDPRIKQIQKLLDIAEGNLQTARNLLLDITQNKKAGKADHKKAARDLSILNEGKVIEGVFEGEQMVAPDGKKYPVPANYASKSKLVEGDTLKLTISEDGGLIYKQINPIERKNLIGVLSYDDGSYSVLAEGKNYKVLFASVTYYKGEPGNKVSIIVPADKESEWAAVESIIHEHTEDSEKTKEPEKASEQNPVKKEEVKETPKVEEKPETKKEEKTEESDIKVELPPENKEILKEVREKFSDEANFTKEEPKVEKEVSVEKESEKEDIKTEPEKKEYLEVKAKESEINDDMTVQEVLKATQEEDKLNQAVQEEVSSEHPNIKGQGEYMKEEKSPLVAEDKETNSLGEEPPQVVEKPKEVKELEI